MLIEKVLALPIDTQIGKVRCALSPPPNLSILFPSNRIQRHCPGCHSDLINSVGSCQNLGFTSTWEDGCFPVVNTRLSSCVHKYWQIWVHGRWDGLPRIFFFFLP